MSSLTKIKSALISVYSKENLQPLIESLNKLGIKLFATGGTFDFIEKLNIQVTAVEDITDYPSILGGRVKTLHPKVFGGILGRRENSEDILQLEKYQIPEIDLVVVDLYPFEKTLAEIAHSKVSPIGGDLEGAVIEKIDVGGVSLIRAAAKNYNNVVIIPSFNEYGTLQDILDNNNAGTSLEQRKNLAAKAFAVTSHYDAAIFNFFNATENIPALNISETNANVLRYGENPHQQGTYFGNLNDVFEKFNGKELSYNNLLDCNAAIDLIAEFKELTLAIIKHNNACGVASRKNLIDAWNDALEGDPVSAFGGVIITNATIDKATALEINKLFFEILIAPAYDADALTILTEKKNRIILKQKNFRSTSTDVRSVLNGFLVQDKDLKTETASDLNCATTTQPTSSQIQDLLFANKIVKQSKSNTIVLAKNNQLLASGVGQTSRVDALKHAIEKARSNNFNLQNAVMASDAFFPFPDCVAIAHEAGITAVIQPGGSMKDKESIEYCNKNGLSMVLSGTRHFKH
jgi:phosphoribosylaminoimidazolecarboxamide formyltransferase / IMP cyclohydrolase